MKDVKKVLRLDQAEYYETHLSIVNCILPVQMTPTQIKVVAAFMALEGDIAQFRFGPSAKRVVRERLNISHAGLSNYLRDLLKEGFLFKEGDLINILPILIPDPNEQQYQFKLFNKSI